MLILAFIICWKTNCVLTNRTIRWLCLFLIQNHKLLPRWLITLALPAICVYSHNVLSFTPYNVYGNNYKNVPYIFYQYLIKQVLPEVILEELCRHPSWQHSYAACASCAMIYTPARNQERVVSVDGYMLMALKLPRGSFLMPHPALRTNGSSTTRIYVTTRSVVDYMSVNEPWSTIGYIVL